MKKVLVTIEIDGTDKALKNITEIENELKNVNKQLKETKDQDAYEQLEKQQLKLKAALAEARKEQRQQIKEIQAAGKAADSYEALNVQLSKLTAQFQKLSQAERQGAIGQGIQAEIQKIDAQLKNLDASTGRFQRNVGNYPREFGKLGRAAKNLGPAFEALGISFDAALGPLGLLLGAVQLFQFAVDTLLPVLLDWFGAAKSVSEIQEELSGQIIEEVSNLDQLAAIAKDESASKEDRATAIKLINEQYGDYLPNLLDENSSLEEITAAQNAATKAIIDNIVAKARATAVQEKLNEAVEKQLVIGRLQAKLAEAQARGDENLARPIRALIETTRQELADIGKEVEQIGKTYNAASLGLQDIFKDLDLATGGTVDIAVETRKRLREIAKEAADEAKKQAKEQQAEAKRQQAEAKRRIEERIREQRKAQEDALKSEEKSFEFLLNLQIQLIQKRNEAIKDGFDKEKAQTQFAFDQQKAAQQKQLDELFEQTQEQEARLIKAFGENSKQVLEFRKRAAEQRAEIERTAADNLRLSEEKLAQDLADIEVRRLDERIRKAVEAEEKAKEQLQRLRDSRQKDLQDDLAQSDKALALANLKAERAQLEALNRAKTNGERANIERLTEAIKVEEELAKIKSDLRRLDDQRELLEAEKLLGIEATKDELTEIERLREESFKRIAELEAKQTKEVETQAQARTQARLKEYESALQGINQATDLAQQASEVFADRADAQVSAQIERQQTAIDGLNDRLQNSTGLQRRFFQQQLEEAEKEAQRLREKQEAQQAEAAKREKFFAIGQSIIRTALAVLQALAAPPGPPLTIPNAIGTGAFGAAQTALIAAQPFATGGLVGAANIPARPNGDNVLATVKTGEVVLTQQQQAALGGADVFRAIGVPGFASGGLVGTPSSPLLASLRRERDQTQAAKAGAIANNRMDNLRVFIVSDDISRDQSEKNKIIKTSIVR